MKRHISKLWLLLLPLLILHFLFLGVREPGYFQEQIFNLGLMVSFVSNLNPNHHVFHGPWWFFSLITQLYVIYYVLVYRHSTRPIVALTFICLIIQIITIYFHADLSHLEYLKYNFVGSVLPFTLGIIAARKKFYPTKRMAVILLFLFFICCFNAYSWLLSSGLISIAILPMTKLVQSNERLYSYLKWIGGMSAFIFVSHPIVRSSIFSLSEYYLYVSILGYVVLSLLFGWGYKRLLLYGTKYWLSLYISYFGKRKVLLMKKMIE